MGDDFTRSPCARVVAGADVKDVQGDVGDEKPSRLNERAHSLQ